MSARPRARVLVVDGNSWPVSRAGLLPGRPHATRGALAPRIIDSDAHELLVEDAAIDDATLIARGRGIDALVIIAGPKLRHRVDALAIASVLREGARPLIFVVVEPKAEHTLREVLLAARLDADAAVMIAREGNRAVRSQRIIDALDAHLPHTPPRSSMKLRAVADGSHAILVGGEAPVAMNAWALDAAGASGFSPLAIVIPSAARAGDVIPLTPPLWRAIEGAVDDDEGPPACLTGRVMLAGDGPPRGADVFVFTDGGETNGSVDETGALVLEHALPLRGGAALGVLVTRTGMRPSTPGALAARVLACFPAASAS